MTQQEFKDRYLGGRGNKTNACQGAVDWLRSFFKDNCCDLREAWKVCERADWMMWAHARVNPDKGAVVAFARWCVKCIAANRGISHANEADTLAWEAAYVAASVKSDALGETGAYAAIRAANLKKHRRIIADKCRKMVPCPWE